MLADLLGNPAGPTAQIFAKYFPRAQSSVGGWLVSQVRAGRIRDLPVPLLLEQLIGPVMAHLLLRPAPNAGSDTPELERVFRI